MPDALEFAGLTGVKHLLLTHHDPMHTDIQLQHMYNHLRETISSPVAYRMAVEGMRFEL